MQANALADHETGCIHCAVGQHGTGAGLVLQGQGLGAGEGIAS